MPPTQQVDWSPTDWPESLEEMRTIDNLLRCSICYEYFDTAVLFQECSHNYCSLCIRQAMVYVPQCPTCFEKTSGNDLKCNRVLDQLVKNFIDVRSKLLDLINKAPVPSATVKKENIEMSDDSACNFEITPARRTRLHQKAKTKKGKSPCMTPRNKRKRPKLVYSDSEDDIKELQAMEIDPVKSPENSSSTSQPADCATNPSFVECPVCAELISSTTINSHLDLCLITREKKSSLRSRRKATETKAKAKPVISTTNPSVSSIVASSFINSPLRSASSSSSSPSHSKTTSKLTGSNALLSCGPKRRKPIPGIVYAILSDKQLKQKLKEWNLSVQGDRKTLIKRHQEFVVLYNAQCDSVNPKSALAIVKEIEKKRRNKNNLNASSTSSNIHLTKDASEEEVNEANQQYVQQNKGQFEKLISDIQKRKEPSTSSNDHSTKSTTVTDDLDSKQNIDTEPSIDQSQPRNQEMKGQRCEEKGTNIGMAQTDVSEQDSSLKTDTSEGQNILGESRISVAHAQQETEDSMKQHDEELETVDQRNPNSNIPSRQNPRQDKDCLEFAGSDTNSNIEETNRVPEPPSISNLDYLNESDPTNDDSDDKNNDDDASSDDDEDYNNDKDWEMTPSFEIDSSDREDDEVKGCASDEDMFAPTPRTK